MSKTVCAKIAIAAMALFAWLSLSAFLMKGESGGGIVSGGGGGGGGGATIAPWFWLNNAALNTLTTANANTVIGGVSIPGTASFTGAIALLQKPHAGFTLAALAAGCTAATALTGDIVISCSGATAPGPMANLKIGSTDKAAGQYEMDLPVGKGIALPGAGTATDCSGNNWTVNTPVDSLGNYTVYKNGVATSGIGVALVVKFDCTYIQKTSPWPGPNPAANNTGYWILASNTGAWILNEGKLFVQGRPYDYQQRISISTGALAADNTTLSPYSGQSLVTNLTGNLGWGAQSFWGPVLSSGAVNLKTPAVKAGVFNHGVTYIKYNTTLPSPAPSTRCQATQDSAVQAHLVAGDGQSFTDGSGNVWTMGSTPLGSGLFAIKKNGGQVDSGDTLTLTFDGNIYTDVVDTAVNGTIWQYNGTSFGTQVYLVPPGWFREVTCPGGF